ncbi:MAG TPA: DedA family protein [Candidatus Avibacteroides avistercoris]|uniref:DedA family protein n=1 Tax=Candidatus Avibacteroides avistercoris TaxID=2840690 RepID=A0A9D2ZU50_9BACT|nr:DedA family protein [Candidatus Avibacteroides avistercoris]
MEDVSFIEWCLNNLNYWTITLLMAIESSFIPFPSEVVVPPAAYKAYHGELNIWLVILFSTLGAEVGALVNYYLAKYLGRPIIYSFAESRVGRMCLLSAKKMEQAEAFFNKHGVISTFIGRLVPAVRQLISIPAGLARMNMPKFLIFTALGALTWNSILAMLGYVAGRALPREEFDAFINEKSHAIGMVFVAIFVLIVAYLVYQGFKKK